MRYVARYTPNPDADLCRGWSAWMGMRDESLIALLSDILNLDVPEGIDEADAAGEAELLELAVDIGHDVRWDDQAGEWCCVHHDGLSCWGLDEDIETPEEAAMEAARLHRTGQIEHAGTGLSTIGEVEYVWPVPGVDGLHLFRCEDTMPEPQ